MILVISSALVVAFIVAYIVYAIKHKDSQYLGTEEKNNFWKLTK